jgi:alkaline phosphatase D
VVYTFVMNLVPSDMKKILIISLFTTVIVACNQNFRQTKIKFAEPVSLLYDSSLKPFYHGIASGDPLADRVIIWTRVTPEFVSDSIPVIWQLSEYQDFSKIHRVDTAFAYSQRDYTVKVDVTGLKPGHHYYYRFAALNKVSPVGRTKTASQNSDSVTFAVVSCSNWEFGYFNPYENIAQKDIDAVVHLGDYIYEYATGKYGDTTIGRKHIPEHEIVSLDDYRTRYSQYHVDKALQHARQQHPFIVTWDDHEVANNVYTEGAQNHQPEEGDFNARKLAAKQAYYEWMPIREEEPTLYRNFSFGKIASLIMLDERLAGKTKPVDSLSDRTFLDKNRSVLGPEQLNWFRKQLTLPSVWKIIGNQVMFSDLNMTHLHHGGSINFDAWDGYPAEKQNIIQWIKAKKIPNIVFVTGDTHASWAIEAASDVSKTYRPSDSNGAFAVELGTTSLSSGNGDESNVPVDTVLQREKGLLRTNPHVKFVNNRDHGYLLINLNQKRLRAEWWYAKTLRVPNSEEFLGRAFEVNINSHKLH